MAKAKKKKEAKPRPEQYEPKVKINGSFSDVIGVAMSKPKEEKKESKK